MSSIPEMLVPHVDRFVLMERRLIVRPPGFEEIRWTQAPTRVGWVILRAYPAHRRPRRATTLVEWPATKQTYLYADGSVGLAPQYRMYVEHDLLSRALDDPEVLTTEEQQRAEQTLVDLNGRFVLPDLDAVVARVEAYESGASLDED